MTLLLLMLLLLLLLVESSISRIFAVENSLNAFYLSLVCGKYYQFLLCGASNRFAVKCSSR